MAGLQPFEAQVEAIRGAFEDLREKRARSIVILERMAAAGAGIGEAELDLENAHVGDAVREQETTVTMAAQLVVGLDNATKTIATDFDGMKRFTRLETFVGQFSRQRARRMRHRRMQEQSLLAGLEDLLSKSETILRLLGEQRVIAGEQHRRAEAGLAQTIERRKQTARLLDTPPHGAGEEERFAEELLLERSTSMSRAMVDSLNDGIAALQTLLHKLTIDRQQRLLLCRAVEGWGFGSLGPGVAGEGQAASRGVQAARDVRRRKALADDAFARRFVSLLEKHDASG